MRVVVHHPERTGEGGETIPANVSAFRLGRIEDHTDILTGVTTPKEEVARILVEQAKEEFPGQEVTIEHLHVGETETHPETGEVTVLNHEWKDHPPEGSVAAGESHEQELSATQSQEVSS